MSFDFLVVGAGSGGIAAARRAASYGARVCLIESLNIGGTCVNVGCIPKKIMFNAASMYEFVSSSIACSYGIDVGGDGGSSGVKAKATFSWEILKEARDKYITKLNEIYLKNIKNDGITLVNGYAKFISPTTVKVGEILYSAKHLLIATGSHPIIPHDISGAKEYGLNSNDFFSLSHQPKKVAVIGCGYIGVELTNILHSLGSQVTIFCREDTLLRKFDHDVSRVVFETMSEAGINIITHSSVQSITKSSIDSSYTVRWESKTNECCADLSGIDAVFFAIGRIPNVDQLQLYSAGVKVDPKTHRVIVDEFQNTSTPGIYAVGDVCGYADLTPVAIAAGRKLSDRLFGGKEDAKLDYSFIPTVVFSHPPVGSIGLTEREAIKEYGKENTRVYTSTFSGMFFALYNQLPVSSELHKSQPAYFFKMITAGKEEKVVGLHLIGKDCDEMIQGFSVAIKMGATKANFDSTIAIHPTASEEVVLMK